MNKVVELVDELSALVEEFGLVRASLRDGDVRVTFGTQPAAYAPAANEAPAPTVRPTSVRRSAAVETNPKGTPVTSPTTGIYYTSSRPGAPAFVKEGDDVAAGQVIGLIEAMKVFNEITSHVSGKVVKVSAANGQLVQPGDPLIYIA